MGVEIDHIMQSAGYLKTSFGWAAPPKEALPKPECCEHCSRLTDNLEEERGE